MDSWVLIVHLLAGGYAETFASEWGCRLAADEARIVWRWERGMTAPGVACRRAGAVPFPPARPRHIVRGTA